MNALANEKRKDYARMDVIGYGEEIKYTLKIERLP
jgi:hypothetical protein